MKLLDNLFGKLGYIRADKLKEQLDYANSIAKRLDEHRKVVLAIEQNTDLFEKDYGYAEHMATQDDYLMRIYRVVYGFWPDADGTLPAKAQRAIVRQRPDILGPCLLPEYSNPRSRNQG